MDIKIEPFALSGDSDIAALKEDSSVVQDKTEISDASYL